MSLIPNFLSPIEFRVSIKRLPHVEFFTQRTSVPAISVNPITYPTRFNPVFQTPDSVTFSNFDFSFIVDEGMKNYLEISDWIIRSAFPENHEQYRSIEEELFSDISITILNSKKNSNINITYENCFPISLSEIQLDTTQADVQYPEAIASFQYDRYKISHI